MLIHHKKLLLAMSLMTTNLYASDFNLPTINASQLGNAYAGWASEAIDASTTFSNAAGLVYLHHPQMVMTGIGVKGHAQFNGTTTLGVGKSNTSIGGFIPSFYYVRPLSSRLTLGFGDATPFALGTNYGKDSLVRYSSTLTKITVLDMVSSLGFKINEQWSIGGGLDIERLAYITQAMVPSGGANDFEAQNHLYGWGYGGHIGTMLQLTPHTRLGLNFNSPVVFHTKGNSSFYTATTQFRNNYQRANTILPALIQLGFTEKFNDRVSMSGTIFYTRWSVLKQLTLQHVMTPQGNVSATIPFNYHDTFDYSLGLNVQANQKLLLKTGFQIMNKPSNDRNRMVSDTTSNATLVSVGAHYNYSKSLEYDFGYAHNFIQSVRINQNTGLVVANGRAYTANDILGFQATWNFV